MKELPPEKYPKAWLSKGSQPEPQLNLYARIQDFLARIKPMEEDLRSHGRTRALALKKLHRICAREVRILKAKLALATVKYYLSQYRDAIRAIDPSVEAELLTEFARRGVLLTLTEVVCEE